MPIHQKSPSQEQFSTRLLALELHRVRQGLARYARRAVGVARDIEPKGSHSAAVIRKVERELVEILARLEGKIQC